ncbi:tRNA (adenosine(37)-N6)-threonylcarbamoyltransferase complex ATPase subunit type 1 TsaE [Tamlana sp. 62-3]|uniref:tRNA threonylcarbamoyladenosine biosynthesis protein TsaE n=1 Tax=Neotamlana sargassicola TaxID=2883125 RepID=A0A9X1L4V9_9FLAO|nr:tRNA (adenosine(37)-N6)-threonylcarbamoyltransferase complex ATPase subunit type 1 TsaE [Tamlana sargassicola]MCB4808535.1 tRNA (adenosine(37)-N6)-threonylcarbamoyltransferase complex ATPase subunit type 1 TsaE [Tamlana sargassicola]
MELQYKLNDIEQVAIKLVDNFNTKTILFYGNMGVGKTTLIKKLVEILGSEDEVSSPTFSIVNEYQIKNDKIYHFDLYRIKDEEELYNFGIEDYLSTNNWILIEWPEIIEPLLFKDCDKVEINLDQELNRILNLTN